MTVLFGPFLNQLEGGYMARCPGCDEVHFIPTNPFRYAGRPCWDFNGNPDAPTFSPSLLIRTGRAVDPNFVREEGDPPDVCHSFIRDGQWQFCSDSTHHLAGQTVPMLPWSDDA
jgi:hypothetical protein